MTEPLFFTPEEAAEKLGTQVSELRGFVTRGKLREFRDSGSTHYHSRDIAELAAELANEDSNAAGADQA